MIGVEPGEGLELPAALGRVAEQRHKGRARAGPACTRSGEIRARRSRRARGWRGSRCRCCAIMRKIKPSHAGCDRPRPSAPARAQVPASRCRMPRAQRARCGRRRASRPRSSTMRGRTGQVAVASLTCVGDVRQRRQHQFDGPARAASCAIASPKIAARRRISLPGCRAAPAAVGGPAMRRRASSAFGRNSRDPLGERVAHIGAGRSVKPRERRRLERQDRQHLVDISAHRARAPRPPGPHRRRRVVDDRNLRRGSCARGAPRGG